MVMEAITIARLTIRELMESKSLLLFKRHFTSRFLHSFAIIRKSYERANGDFVKYISEVKNVSNFDYFNPILASFDISELPRLEFNKLLALKSKLDKELVEYNMRGIRKNI